MADGANALAGAKEALQHAEETERLTRPSPTPVPEGLRPKNEYSSASYSLVNKVKKATGNDSQPGLEKELSAKKEMVDKAKKALE